MFRQHTSPLNPPGTILLGTATAIRHAQRTRPTPWPARRIRPSRAHDAAWRPLHTTRRTSPCPHRCARPDWSRWRSCAPTPATVPAPDRLTRDAACGGYRLGAPTRSLGIALSPRSVAVVGSSASTARRCTCPPPLLSGCADRTPVGPPRGTQRSAPAPTAGRSANRRRTDGID
jgi:hypothetical protein